MSRRDHLDLARRELADHGIVPTVTQTRGDHLRMEWIAGGKRQFIITGLTPSTRYAGLYSRSQVRRLLREAKVWNPSLVSE